MYDDKGPQGADLTPELAALQRQLAGLQLAPVQMDRDQLMFAAGRAAALSEQQSSGTRRAFSANGWLWPSATALMTAASIMLAAKLVWRDEETTIATDSAKPQAAVEQLVNQPASADVDEVERVTSRFATSPNLKRPTAGYLGVRYVALTEGIEVTGPTHTASDNGSSWGEGNSAETAPLRGTSEEPLRVRSLDSRIRS